MEGKRFFKIMMPGFHKKMNLPQSFCDKLKQEISDAAVIKSPKGTWEIQVCRDKEGGQISFKNGWLDFVHRHGLSIGDFVVFEHTGDLHFNVVFVFDMSACEKELVVDRKRAAPPRNARRQQTKKKLSWVSCKSKNPSFVLTMMRHHAHKYNNTVCIPSEFLKSNPMDDKTIAVLRDPEKREWGVRLYTVMERGRYCRTRMGGRGWNDFHVGNKIKVGDVCVFKVRTKESRGSTDVVMDVQIRRK